MIEHLATLINTFPGTANQTRCFTHILNLFAKSILRQFEVPKGKGTKAIDNAAKELAAVSDEIDDDVEEASKSGSNEGDGDVGNDDVDGLPDERNELSGDELSNLEESLNHFDLF